ncbi:hypothetical protein ENBRE01_0982 [Enteropsectra breve]|nr:hypothetical protein ENBRE01_0982 [Enteropsectra breve]
MLTRETAHSGTSTEEIIRTLLSQEVKNINNLEVEARLGTITDMVTRERINFKTPMPMVFTERMEGMFFSSGVTELDYGKLSAVLSECKHTESKDKIMIRSNIRKIEKDEMAVYQKKVRRFVLNVYMPQSKYDLRISVSIEASVEPNQWKVRAGEFVKTRFRSRTSYEWNEYSFDFTKVSSKANSSPDTYEVEVEISDLKNYKIEEFINIVLNLSSKANQ